MGKKIAIVGGGPAGAIALDTFLNAGFNDVVLFERHRVAGGAWTLDEQLGFQPHEDIPGISQYGSELDPARPIPEAALDTDASKPLELPANDAGPHFDESPLYPQVETNVLAEMMSFTNNPVPPIQPPGTKERFGIDDAYRTHDVVRDYILQYFKGRERYLKLNTSVEKAYQPKGPGTTWKLVLRQRSSGNRKDTWWTEDFDFLYAASGRFNVPYVPKIEGLLETAQRMKKGSIIHTKVFRDPAAFKDKTVLLVGASFSNVDVAHLVHAAGARSPIHLSLRHILPISLPGFAQPWIVPHPAIKRIVASSDGASLDVTFDDGTQVHNVDKLVFGTGYVYSYPYLEDYLRNYGGIVDSGGHGTHNLYWSTWWKYDPSLVITSNITDSLFWRFIEAQAKASVGLWKQDPKDWPTPYESDLWETKRRSLNLYDFHIWYPRFSELLDGLASVGKVDFGEYPNYVYLMEQSFGLKGKYWESLAKKEISEHPELENFYAKTLKYLTDRVVTRF